MSKEEIERTVDTIVEQPPPELPDPAQMDLGDPQRPVRYGSVDPHTLNSIVLYVLQGVPTGSFLKAVLSNDLMRAVGKADEQNLRTLNDICGFIFNRCPLACWGDATKVEEWISMKGLEGSGQHWDFELGKLIP